MRRWQEIKNKKMSPERIAELDRQVREELDAMTLRELREVSGKTQIKVAELAATTQAQLSQIEEGTEPLSS